MNTHRVTKNLPGPDGIIQAGTEVDASAWRNTSALESQRYLMPLSTKAALASASVNDLPKRRGRKPGSKNRIQESIAQ